MSSGLIVDRPRSGRLERVRVAICQALGVSPVTHSYQYVAEAALAAIDQEEPPKQGLCPPGHHDFRPGNGPLMCCNNYEEFY